MSEKGLAGRFSFLKSPRRDEADSDASGGQRLVLAMVISVASLAALALTLVWLNIERTKLAYRERTLQHEAAQALDLNAKLNVERDHLLSPHALKRRAESLGLGPAKPGQLRRMEDEPASAAPATDQTSGE